MRYRTALALVLATAPLAAADDWPQWMGPKRDNVWRETGLLDSFPAGGPKVLWRSPVAGGYAGPAVAGGRVFATDYKAESDLGEGNFERKEANGTERVFALDEATGKPLWEQKYPVRYTISYPQGPRCTPTVDGDRVYFLGAEGALLCCEAATGKIVWKKDLKKDYGTKAALWGYAAHPLIDGKKLITLAGGEGSHVVALDKLTGAELWKAGSQSEQGYVPPSIIEAGGVRQLVTAGPRAVAAFDPETGNKLWTTPYEATNGGVIMTPVKVGDLLYLGGYSDKNILLKLTADKPGVEVVWRDKRKAGVSPINVQPFADGNTLYGLDQSGHAYAVALPSGERLWESDDIVGGTAANSATAFIVKNGERFVFFTEKGDLVLGKLTPKGYEETSRAKVLEATGRAFGRKVVWSMPAFANKHAYVRNDKELIAVDLSK